MHPRLQERCIATLPLEMPVVEIAAAGGPEQLKSSGRPVIYQTFPLAEASSAHRLMESSQHVGKIVLTL
jgi:NADPH:quinone reductase-like Zn-dependent oxidoreductase